MKSNMYGIDLNVKYVHHVFFLHDPKVLHGICVAFSSALKTDSSGTAKFIRAYYLKAKTML